MTHIILKHQTITPSKHEIRKQKRFNKRYMFEKDIKYRGPFSYRILRIIGWIAIACTFAGYVNSWSTHILPAPILPTVVSNAFSYISTLSLPLFIIATFSTILSRNRTIKSVLMVYFLAYFAIAGLMLFAYYRYIESILLLAGIDKSIIGYVSQRIAQDANVNVFADLLALSTFYYFLNYIPRKHFKGNKIKLFRAFAILPILFIIASYVLKVLRNFEIIELPFALIPFLTTKSPAIHLVCIVLVLGLKKIESNFYKKGGTREQFVKFEQSNRNSLRFSLAVSALFTIVSLLSFILFYVSFGFGIETFSTVAKLNLLNDIGVIFAVPLMPLFSYTRKHKNNRDDIIIVLAGIALVALATIESCYNIIIQLLSNH